MSTIFTLLTITSETDDSEGENRRSGDSDDSHRDADPRVEPGRLDSYEDGTLVAL